MEEYSSPATTFLIAVSEGTYFFSSCDSAFGDVLQRAPVDLESC